MGGCEPDDFLRGGDRLDALEFDLSPAIDERYRLLADRRRRALVYLLVESGERTHSLATLAAQIAGLVGDGSLNPSGLAIELRHKLLPPLETLGVVEFDERSGTLVYRGDECLEALLDPSREFEVREK